MSLSPLKLLTRSGALRGSKDRLHAYRLLENSLPKFSPPSSSCGPPMPDASQGALFIPAPEANTPVVAPPAPPVAPTPPAPPTPSPLHDARAPRPATPRLARPNFFRRWLARWFKKPRPAGVASVQTELALARVTVVRNDLSEDDMEVAPAPRGPAEQSAANPPPDP